MVIKFINIRKVPREGEKPLATPSVFNTSLGTLRMLMNGKSCLIPLLEVSTLTFQCGNNIVQCFGAKECNKLLPNVYNVGLDSSDSHWHIRMVVGLIHSMKSFQKLSYYNLRRLSAVSSTAFYFKILNQFFQFY